MISSSRTSESAFSLIEVVLALGIATFAIVVVAGLLPVGLKLSRESEDESRAINILSAVAADRQATPFGSTSEIYKVPTLVGSKIIEGSFAVKDDDSYGDSDFGNARYRVSYSLVPPSPDSLNPWMAYFRIYWPAREGNQNSTALVEKVVAIPQP